MKLEEKNGLRILTPENGYLLRRNEDDTNFSEIVYLGKNDTEDSYTEIPQAEAELVLIDQNADTTDTPQEYADLTPLSSNSKKVSVQAGKQYYNEKKDRIVSEYNDFSESNQSATILSSEPINFEGDNVLTPSETPDSEYILYTLRYMQTSDIKFVIAITATSMDAPQGGLRGEDIETSNTIEQ